MDTPAGKSRPECQPCPGNGSLAIVGTGPGHPGYLAPRALAAISHARYVFGNAAYLRPLEDLLDGREIIRDSLGTQIDRAKKVIGLAESFPTVIVSGGDPGVYGVAGIVLDEIERSGSRIEVEIIPGITAATAAASRVGSPLSGDYATISLSNLITPMEVIGQRLEAVFSVKIPVVLYNPKSRGKPHNLGIAIEHARRHLPAQTPVALVKNALRDGEEITISTLGEIETVLDRVDMHTTVIIGGEESRIWRMNDHVRGIITPRGYHRKYVY